MNQNRWCGVVFDDDGSSHVGRSQSAENTERTETKCLVHTAFRQRQLSHLNVKDEWVTGVIYLKTYTVCVWIAPGFIVKNQHVCERKIKILLKINE